MAETNITGPLWSFEQRSRILGSYWPTSYTMSIPDATAGWWVHPSLGVQRTIFATDTEQSLYRTSMSKSNQSAALSTFTYGWISGGGDTTTNSTYVQRITFAADTTAVSQRGGRLYAKYIASGAGNNEAGWIASGRQMGGAYAAQSSVERILYATDTATASGRGSLAAARGGWCASTGTSTNGWWAGNGNIDSNIDRITYATDTATASVRGTLIASNYGMYATTDSTTFGWFAGGSSSPSYLGVTTIQRITYATDTASTTLRGSLTQTQSRLAATTNMNYGWWGGGFNGVSTYYSTVSRLTYATDTANASSRGPLGGAVYTLSGVSGIA